MDEIQKDKTSDIEKVIRKSLNLDEHSEMPLAYPKVQHKRCRFYDGRCLVCGKRMDTSEKKG